MGTMAFYNNLSIIPLRYHKSFSFLIMYCFFAIIQCYNENNYGHKARRNVKIT